ncbi:MAG: phospho-N-acetylmuramoyl-pentapeptide-transferase [Clostridiales bacterium]|nr:phospho-N-acetylmuramoyl-pentapeptide-transferase [Clostridiales bacterium]
MQRVIWATVLAFAIAMVLGPVVIPWLKKMKFGQTIYELGLESHKVKQGTPTMGGIIFAVPMIIVPILFSTADQRWSFLPMALVSTLGFGLVGFVDDYIKVSKKRSLGLTPMQKIVPQVVISLVLAIWAYCTPQIGSALIVPFTDKTWDLGLFYIPVMMFVLVGTVNSANLLDGVDGLLSGCSLIDFATMALVCVALGAANPENAGNMTNMMVFCGAAAGGILGFLRFNTYPANVFMGDVGSFTIGGALVAVAMVTRTALLLPMIALAMLVSSLSDIIQVGYFKYTKKKTGAGKRVFRMAPLHHHFEKGGMPETRIVSMYMSVTALLCLIALTMFF